MIPLISSADQLITNFLHPVIQLSTLGGTRQKLLLQLLCLICRDIFFIAKLMFQTCPEIHGDSSKLDFHIYHFFVFLQKDRHLHDQMQASVTTGFWIFYIIFFLDQYNIILAQKAVCQLEKLGLIYPVKGRGNFVADSSQVQKINRESYRKEFTALIQKGRNTGFNREELEKMLAEIFEKEDES